MSSKETGNLRVIERPDGAFEGHVEIVTTGAPPFDVRYQVYPARSRVYIRPPRPLNADEMALVDKEIADMGRIYRIDTPSFETTVHSDDQA